MRDVEKSKMYFRHKINSSPNLSIKKRKRKKKPFFLKPYMDQGLREVKKKLTTNPPPLPPKKGCLQALKNNYNNPCEYQIIRSIIN